MFINRYTVNDPDTTLVNSRVQAATEAKVRELMIDLLKPKNVVDQRISMAILALDPNNQGDDEWYAYHQTLVAIAGGLSPVDPPEAGIPGPWYEYVVDLAAPPAGTQEDYHDLATLGSTDNTITVRGTQQDILNAHNALITEGPWRGYWHDPTSEPIERPVYEDEYNVHDWKMDRQQLIDQWGLARYIEIYPLPIQARDYDTMTALNSKALYDIFNATPNNVKDRIPETTQGLMNQVDLSWDQLNGFAKSIYESGDVNERYDQIQQRKQAGWNAYREVTEGIIEV